MFIVFRSTVYTLLELVTLWLGNTTIVRFCAQLVSKHFLTLILAGVR